MASIKYISARQILNAKGNPTIEATVVLDDAAVGIAACPSGTSTGTYEAVELHDEDKQHFAGLGVLKAINHIEHRIASKLIGMDPSKQSEIDKAMIELDGTENKSGLGANAMLSISMAVAKAAANSNHQPLYRHLFENVYYVIASESEAISPGLPRRFTPRNDGKLTMPTPIFNEINGGLHGSGSLDFQEFILVPAREKSYSQSLHIGFSVYRALKQLIHQNNYSTLVGDEGGFEPHLGSNRAALEFLVEAIGAAGVTYGEDVFLGFDAAANSFFKDGSYHVRDKKKPLTASDLVAYYLELAEQFKIKYMEDILNEDDWNDWLTATLKLKDHSMVVGDDLIATNPKRLQTAIDKKAATALIIKPNQIGTITETMEVVQMAQKAGFRVIVSHRSGETNDDFIADFGVAVEADYVKFGAPARGERVAKYNRLLQIESELQKE